MVLLVERDDLDSCIWKFAVLGSDEGVDDTGALTGFAGVHAETNGLAGLVGQTKGNAESTGSTLLT